MSDDQRLYLLVMSAACQVMLRQGKLRVSLADVLAEPGVAVDEGEVRRVCDEVAEEIRIDDSGMVSMSTLGYGPDAR